jgi:Mg-chelatase subunit ChlI
MHSSRQAFPFSAIVGQEKLKMALLLNAVNPKVGGVLIRGEKGTAKSTAVRALSDLLPEIEVVRDCPIGCQRGWENQHCPFCLERKARGEELNTYRRRTRVVELPVGATEDRVLGTLDLEQAIQKGEKHFDPGILARANRGILYVDEVNLLEDHIVDVLLDAAAMGVNSVEREGVSFSHPAEFILVGTMNPEEGELRPQLLDRFGLCVMVEGIADLDQRLEVVKRRAAFEDDSEWFRQRWRESDLALAQQIGRARNLLPEVDLPDQMLRLIGQLAIEMKVDGHRADIVMMKTAKTLAAWRGRREVLPQDVREATDMALPHRMRRRPFQKIGVDAQKMASVLGV